jgi:outer membrane usher protein FimD/PapC
MAARTHLTTVIVACVAAASTGGVHAQAGEEIIVSVRANSVARGEFTVIQAPGGDFWVLPEDLPRLQVKPVPGAQRAVGAATYYSLRGLGATALTFDEATLALRLDFPAAQLAPTRLDLSRRPEPLPLTTPPTSTILNYRVSARQVAEGAPVQLRLATDLNVRVGEVLLRQEAKVETGSDLPTFTRGRSQLLWDDRVEGRRVVAGDQLTAGGPFGTVFPGAGVSVTRCSASRRMSCASRRRPCRCPPRRRRRWRCPSTAARSTATPWRRARCRWKTSITTAARARCG